MKNKRKSIPAAAAILTAALLVSACGSNGDSNANTATNGGGSQTGNASAGPADPFGKYAEPVELAVGQKVDPSDKSLPAGDTPENNQFTRYIKDNLNIDVTDAFTASPTNYDQKVSLSISSNDLPDAMIVNAQQLRSMYENGQLADLTEAFGQYASPALKRVLQDSNKRALDTVTFDGKIMALPQAEDAGIHEMWIRKDWLDKLGLEPPKTMADLEKVAEAFVKQDPDGDGKADTIGIAGPSSSGKMYANFLDSANNLYGFDPIFSAYGAYPGYWVKDADGNPAYGSTLPQTKEALGKLRDLYAKGLIDPQMAIRTDSGESIVSGQTGMFFAPWWMGYGPLTDAVKQDPKANWQAYALPLDAEGRFSPHLSAPAGQFVVISKDYKHPEAVIKLQNLLLRDENQFDLAKGSIGFYPVRLALGPSDESEFTVQAVREVLAGTKKPEDFADKPEYKLLAGDLNNIKKVKLEPYDKMDIQYWNPTADMGAWTRLYSIMVGVAPFVDVPMNRVSSLLYSQTNAMETKWTNLKKMEDETFLKIVVGGAPLDTFDKFVADWKKEGGDQITAEVAEAVKP
ncbi:extracellular solute-binding protein [Paenibacillus sp. GCM10023250]|uniref:extracellular solute-binding protein n=1 Tax=Paenibacillus sp. GCM10023250 TaxID=3252648 RepID=UPI003608C1C4